MSDTNGKYCSLLLVSYGHDFKISYTAFLMSLSFNLVTRFRKIFTETENSKKHTICFLYFTKPKKKNVVAVRRESGFTNNRPTYVFCSVNVKLKKEQRVS